MSTAPETAALRAVLVDDEPLALANLSAALDSHPDVAVVGTALDGRHAIQAIRAHDPDLLFLDVQMPEIDGFGVLRELGEEQPPAVIFVTAYDRHAVRAFEVHALDYLLKPFDDERLADCVQRAVSHVRTGRRGDLRRVIDTLLQELSPGAPTAAAAGREYAQRIMVRNRDRIHFVLTADVDWLQAAGNYVRVHAGSAQHLIRSTLAELQDRLDPSRFVRIHRSTIVNLARIREVQPWHGGDYLAILHDGRTLKVSRTYRDDLLRPIA